MFPYGQNLYSQNGGIYPESVEVPHLDVRGPTTTDTAYPLGKWWLWPGNGLWELLNLSSAGGTLSATWVQISNGSGPILTITGDTGGPETALNGNFNILGTANQVAVTGSAHTETISLIGPYTPATYTAHGVLIGEGSSSIVATTPGTDGQVLTGNTGADPSFAAIGTKSGLTAHGVVISEGTGAFAATAAGASGTLLSGVTGADPVFTASPSVTGNMTAATGFIATTAGAGLLLNSPAASAAAPGPVVVNGRSGQATFTSVSIAAAADLTLTITNSSITGSTTQVIYSMSGSTTGSAPSIKSVTNTAGSSAIVVTNGTGATTTTADITLNFIVLN